MLKNETHQIEYPEGPEAPEEDEGLRGRVGGDVRGHPAEPDEADDEDDEVDDARNITEEGARSEEHALGQHLKWCSLLGQKCALGCVNLKPQVRRDMRRDSHNQSLLFRPSGCMNLAPIARSSNPGSYLLQGRF